MNWKEKEARLNYIWDKAPMLERQGKYTEALGMWREAYAIKQELGATGAGDVAELYGLKKKIESLSPKAHSKN